MTDDRDRVERVARKLFELRGHGFAPPPHWDQEPNPLRDECLDDAPAVLAAAEPPGWKLVPVVPTEEMVDEGKLDAGSAIIARATWRSMLNAVPLPPPPGADNE